MEAESEGGEQALGRRLGGGGVLEMGKGRVEGEGHRSPGRRRGMS